MEEGNRKMEQRDRVFLANVDGLIWQANHQNREPQDGAMGDFDPASPGLEIFCRHRGPGLAANPIPPERFQPEMFQKPFVLNARGKVIADYSTQEVFPADFNLMGLQVCQTIHWGGSGRPLVAATEREQNGQVAVIDPLTGKFLLRLQNEKADRLYVCDVSGDWREEIVILNGNELHVYHNHAPNPNPEWPSLWDRGQYRRSMMTWNRSTN